MKYIDSTDIWVLKLIIYLGIVFTFIIIPLFHYTINKWYWGLFLLPFLIIVWIIMVVGINIIGE